MTFILKLLSNAYEIKPEELYEALNYKSQSWLKLADEDVGLGKIFAVATRDKYKDTDADVTRIFEINDKQGKRSAFMAKNIDKLKMSLERVYKLSQLFKTGDKKLGIRANPQRRALLLALYINLQGSSIKHERLDELATLYPRKMLMSASYLAIREALYEKYLHLRKTMTVIDQLLFVMSSIQPVGGLKEKKNAQRKSFIENLKDLRSEHLIDLCEYMAKVQAGDPSANAKYFKQIRQERFSLFGSGNTATWQAMFTAAKTALLVRLGAPLVGAEMAKTSLNPKIEMPLSKFERINKVLSVHSGRWYTGWFFSTTSAGLFNTHFKPVAQEPKKPQAPARRIKSTQATKLAFLSKVLPTQGHDLPPEVKRASSPTGSAPPSPSFLANLNKSKGSTKDPMRESLGLTSRAPVAAH